MKGKQFWNADKVLSLSALLISLATFLVLIYQTYLANEQNRLARMQQYASVLPYLQLGPSSPDPASYHLYVGNNGVGPAFIKAVSVHYRGKSYSLDPARFIHEVIFPADTIDFYYANLAPGRVISAGQNIELIGVQNSIISTNKLKKLFDQNAEIEIEYASVYGETWRVRGTANPPVSLFKHEE